eukprot:CAMPEP_0181073406 /NCGR_PEP_ID=MMETSP1070-20121207/29062_1 /TAXON_ID=265543 /ORGANISM="Minutocellus polymorphus, Strain NH13" /LENGTH=78 /DNA_ID=CAMNT_0023154475 /DNA_START=375 /DNA_END=609 /DNA_ORIENTATION=+
MVQIAPALADMADVADGHWGISPRKPPSIGDLQHVADDGRSESLDDAIDADYYATDTDINPDSGDEDYTIQDWVEDPS